LERIVGDWQPHRYAWKLPNVRAIKANPYLDKQKLFTAEIETMTRQHTQQWRKHCPWFFSNWY